MKTEDLTIKQIKGICKKYSDGKSCNEKCPFLKSCSNICWGYPSCWQSEDMEREIEGVSE